jgi:hypothetical protein
MVMNLILYATNLKCITFDTTRMPIQLLQKKRKQINNVAFFMQYLGEQNGEENAFAKEMAYVQQSTELS